MSTLAREPEVITRRGKPVSVILPIKDYQELIERLEDVEDVAYLKKARAKPQSFRPLKDYIDTLPTTHARFRPTRLGGKHTKKRKINFVQTT